MLTYEQASRRGIHNLPIWIYVSGMDTVFDDLSEALRAPRTDDWRPVRLFALDLAAKLALGLAIGLGVGIGMAIAG